MGDWVAEKVSLAGHGGGEIASKEAKECFVLVIVYSWCIIDDDDNDINEAVCHFESTGAFFPRSLLGKII